MISYLFLSLASAALAERSLSNAISIGNARWVKDTVHTVREPGMSRYGNSIPMHHRRRLDETAICQGEGTTVNCTSGIADPKNVLNINDTDCQDGCVAADCGNLVDLNSLQTCLESDSLNRTLGCTYEVTSTTPDMPVSFCQSSAENYVVYANIDWAYSNISDWKVYDGNFELYMPYAISKCGGIEGTATTMSAPVDMATCTPLGMVTQAVSHVSGANALAPIVDGEQEILLTGFEALFTAHTPNVSSPDPYTIRLSIGCDLTLPCDGADPCSVIWPDTSTNCYFKYQDKPQTVGQYFVVPEVCAAVDMTGDKPCLDCVGVLGCSYCSWTEDSVNYEACGIPPSVCGGMNNGQSNTCGASGLMSIGASLAVLGVAWVLL